MNMEHSVIAGYPIVLPDFRAAFHREHPGWHKGWLDSIHRHLKPDDVVIDVGSEQGDLSALVASWVPDGGIVLVEPQPLFWATIRETFEANGLKPIDGWQAMLSDEPKGWMYESRGPWPQAAYGEEVDDPGFFHLNEHDSSVAAQVPLTHFVADSQIAPTALLIDVEGAELRVLRGAFHVLQIGKPQVWCAVHPEIMSIRYGHDANDLLAYMDDLGYDRELLGFAGEIHVRFFPK